MKEIYSAKVLFDLVGSRYLARARLKREGRQGWKGGSWPWMLEVKAVKVAPERGIDHR